MTTLADRFASNLRIKKTLVKRPKKGDINHDYLVPGGPYNEQWDWDGFFIGMALASEMSSEAIYLKNWALNYLEHVRADGFTPGLLTPTGIDKRLHHMKPFLAQGCFFASRFLGDFSWLAPHMSVLQRSVGYREKMFFDARTGLGSWYDSMESGADNNVAALDYPRRGVLAADLNGFLYREYVAMAHIAKALNNKKDHASYSAKTELLKKNILTYLWNEKDNIFYNLEKKSGKHIQRATYASLIPLWSGIASYEHGRGMIKRWVLNPKKMRAKWGIRTLSADDPSYNQVNMIKPHSNWQGPVWPLVNSLTAYILLDYGFKKEALRLAETTAGMLLADIKKTGGMHENYNAETGKPLAAPDFVSWNLLVGHLIPNIEAGINPFRLSALADKK
ncbi:MAG: trehalase family glycosidase [Patescibacteria group bacterium]